ncbi:ferrous iron transport protein B [Desulfovibrio sp.]|uniref:ferrous iron transport protein B n=1 Tax=Desulfovibrio sp. TaxID=885 RepID=UPI0025B7B893|nr:ferrous iron transport protein B [Desulfovibrio sp.]
MSSIAESLIAVAGQPNTGKSTIFSALTGVHQEVGNWPGKTVEKKQARAPQSQGGYSVVDLPGSYSLHAHSPEERIAVDYLLHAAPDITVVVASALSPERTLAYALEVMALERPMVLALNMTDMAEKNGIYLDVQAISAMLGVPVVPLSAIRKKDVASLREAVRQSLYIRPQPGRLPVGVLQSLPPPLAETAKKSITLLQEQHGFSEQAALALIWRSMSGEGESTTRLQALTGSLVAPLLTDEARRLFAAARRDWIARLTGREGREALTRQSATAAWDRWFLHAVTGPCIMAAILLLALCLGFGVGFPLAYLTGQALSLATPHILALEAYGLPLIAAMSTGVWHGVSAVLAMLPFVAVFYMVFAVLDDVGYMARAAFIMDRAMSRLGLDGKAFVPLLFAIPCNISGIVGCRTIDDPRQRLLTILVVPLVPCTAKIIVMVTLSAWLFTPTAAILVVLGLLTLNTLTLAGVCLLAGKMMPAPVRERGLLMELPHFHRPNARAISRYVSRNIMAFIKKASTLIVAFSAVLWFLSYYPSANIEQSLLGQMGRVLQPLGDLMGADWRLLTALLASGVSKEALMATLGVLYDTSAGQLAETLRAGVSQASALAFMCAQSLFLPCVSTVGILYSEARSLGLLAAVVVYSLVLPFGLAILVYQAARLLP